jgi:hypothetical protein
LAGSSGGCERDSASEPLVSTVLQRRFRTVVETAQSAHPCRPMCPGGAIENGRLVASLLEVPTSNPAGTAKHRTSSSLPASTSYISIRSVPMGRASSTPSSALNLSRVVVGDRARLQLRELLVAVRMGLAADAARRQSAPSHRRAQRRLRQPRCQGPSRLSRRHLARREPTLSEYCHWEPTTAQWRFAEPPTSNARSRWAGSAHQHLTYARSTDLR